MDPSMGQVSFETARLALSQLQFDGAAARQIALERAARICSDALGVERVGVWLLKNDGKDLVCPGLFVRTEGCCRPGPTIDLTAAPAYQAALGTRKVIVANDAQNAPDTRELADSYLKPHGIASMLDAPVFHDGEVVGVVCLEHVGSLRTWTDAERAFAASVADMVGLVLEQTARREAEGALRDRAANEADLHRHALLGQVASSVGHDFANIMQGIGLIASALPNSNDAERSRLCLDLEKWTRLGMDLVQQLKDFSVAERSAAICDATATVLDLEPMLSLLCKGAAQIRFVHPQGPLWASISRTDLERILVNLVLNARDAVQPLGHISIAIRVADADLEIDVCDDGQGISKQLIDHVFEPYFTTKAHGTGLGLATVRRIMDSVQGQVRVKSRPGAGSCFTIVMRRAAAPNEPDAPET